MHDWRMNIIATLMNDGLYYTDIVYTDYRLHNNNSVGLNRHYLTLPQWESTGGSLRWTQERLATVIRSTWKDKNNPYGRLTGYEFGHNGGADNLPENLIKSYFKICQPSKKTRTEFDEWARYVRAKKTGCFQKKLSLFSQSSPQVPLLPSKRILL